MSTISIMNSSNDIMINPLTQKPIKIGGRVYIKLVNDGVISAHNDLLKNELDTYENDDNAKELIQNYNEILKEDKKNLQAVRGRGKHQNKIVTRRKQTTTPTKLGKLYKENTEYYIHDDDDDDDDNEELSEIDIDDF